MKFLVDAQLPPRLARWLREQGAADAQHVYDREGGLLMPDGEIWRQAKAEDRVIVTKDTDFYDMSAVYGRPPVVLLLRYGNCSTRTMLERLEQAWPTLRTLIQARDTRLVLVTSEAIEVHRAP